MRTYDEAWEAATDKRPFSNGTEGYAWQDNWCGSCLNDSEQMVDEGRGCPLLLVALMDRTPAEWIEQPWGQVKGRPEGVLAPYLGDTYHCTEYRERGEGEPDPPAPVPEDPNQITIFEVFMDQAVEQFEAVDGRVPA